jgi:hypothetical protein
MAAIFGAHLPETQHAVWYRHSIAKDGGDGTCRKIGIRQQACAMSPAIVRGTAKRTLKIFSAVATAAGQA